MTESIRQAGRGRGMDAVGWVGSSKESPLGHSAGELELQNLGWYRYWGKSRGGVRVEVGPGSRRELAV